MTLLLATLAALSAVPTSVTLTSNEKAFPSVLLAQADTPAVAPAADDPGALRVELERLNASRPSLVTPVVLLSVGGALTSLGLVGLGLLLGVGAQGLGELGAGAIVVMFLGVYALIPGVVVLVAGAILLAAALRERSLIRQKTEALQQKLNESPSLAAPPPAGAVQGLVDAPARVVLATF